MAVDSTAIGMAHVDLLTPLDEWLSAIEFRTNWASARAALPAHTLPAVLTCHGPLSQARPLRSLAEDELARLSGLLLDLHVDVRDLTDIDPKLRRFLLRHIADMDSAIREYEVTGSSRLVDVMDSALGNFASTRPIPTTEVERSMWQRMVQLSKDVQEMVKAVVMAGGLGVGIMGYVDAGDYVVDAYRKLQEGVEYKEYLNEPKELPAATPAVAPGERAEESGGSREGG